MIFSVCFRVSIVVPFINAWFSHFPCTQSPNIPHRDAKRDSVVPAERRPHGSRVCLSSRLSIYSKIPLEYSREF